MITVSETREARPGSGVTYATLVDDGVTQALLDNIPENPLDRQTLIPRAIETAMQSAHDPCQECVLFQVSRPQPVGRGLKARCSGMELPDELMTYSQAVKSGTLGQATMRIHGPIASASLIPGLITNCGVTPAKIYIVKI